MLHKVTGAKNIDFDNQLSAVKFHKKTQQPYK